MKKILLTVYLFISFINAFADGENVCVVNNTGNTGQECTASSLGYVTPCSMISFVVNYNIPQGYAIVAQYEWFLNGVSVKVTNIASDPIFQWVVTSKNVTVYCKVTL